MFQIDWGACGAYPGGPLMSRAQGSALPDAPPEIKHSPQLDTV